MLTAAQIIALKQVTLTEIARRCGYGSITAYNGTSYDLGDTPAPGTPITAQQGKAVINPILQIKDVPGMGLVNESANDGSIPQTSGQPIPGEFDVSLQTTVDNLKSEVMTGSTTSCRGACTGLCVGTCTTTCDGCSGCAGCGSTCGGCTGCSGCGSSCATGCQGCSGACSGCSSGCSGCRSGCGSSCSGGCSGSSRT